MKRPLPGSLVGVVVVLLLGACREEAPPPPVVDVSPIGDALRFIAVAIVLGGIIAGIFNLWSKP